MIFNMTGQPVSQEMADAIDRLGQGEYIPCSELDKIPEVKLAYSILNENGERIKVDLESRKPLQDSVYAEMQQITSATVDEDGKIVVDGNGETVYNGIVNREARLDIVMGLPASGKSSSLVDPISSEFHSRLIDNDEAKKRFPEYNNGWGAEVVHKESKAICNKLFNQCIQKKENIVLPKVGSDSTKLLQAFIKKAKAEGYHVYVHFADLDRNKALGRMLSRFCENGRFLRPSLTDNYAPVKNGKTHNYIQDAYEALKKSGMVDGFTKWDNDVAKGEKPILIENIGCEGKFIENAGKKEEQGHDQHEQRGNEESGHKILGDRGSGERVGGNGIHSGVIPNRSLGGVPQSPRGNSESDIRSSLGQLSASGDHGDEHRGSAGISQKDDMKKPCWSQAQLQSDKMDKTARENAAKENMPEIPKSNSRDTCL